MYNTVTFGTRLWHTLVCLVLALGIFIGGVFVVDAIRFPCLRFSNVEYGSKEMNVMDIYIPKNTERTDEAGAVLFIYETGWSAGLKSAVEDRVKACAAKGYVAATMSVTHVAMGASVWDNMDEIEAAIKKLQDFSLQKGISLKNLALHGTSSGAHLAMLFGWGMPERSVLDIKFLVNLSGATEFSSETWTEWSYSGWYGPTLACMLDGREKYASYEEDGAITAAKIPEELVKSAIERVSPVSYLSEESVPVICGYCKDGNDGIIPTKNKTILYDMLDAAGVKSERFCFEKSTHSLSSDRKTKEALYDTFYKYCEEYFGY